MRWWPWQRRPSTGWKVVLYHRAGCHLCDDAWELLVRMRDRYALVLEKHDVDADPALAAEFGECVPVVTVNGRVRFRGKVSPVLLRRLFGSGNQAL